MPSQINLPPDPEGLNDLRAEKAQRALNAFIGADGEYEFETKETAFTDLLVDLMHWCDRRDVDYEDRATAAQNHYYAETTADDEVPQEDLDALQADRRGTTKPSPRYTIELSIHKVKDDGDTESEEEEGCTADWALEDLDHLTGIMHYYCALINDFSTNIPGFPGLSPRRSADDAEPKNDAPSTADWPIPF